MGLLWHQLMLSCGIWSKVRCEVSKANSFATRVQLTRHANPQPPVTTLVRRFQDSLNQAYNTHTILHFLMEELTGQSSTLTKQNLTDLND